MNARATVRILRLAAAALVTGLIVATPLPSVAATHGSFGGVSHGYSGGHYGGYGSHYGGGYYPGWHGYYPGWHGYYGGWGGYWGWRGYYGGGWGWWGWPGGVFLATLPLYYSTLWWNGVPYYYVDDNYYVYSNSANGYVAVSPPPNAQAPVAGSQGAPYAAPGYAPPGAAGSTDLFVYPKNSQSDAQIAQDRQQCQAWAASQNGAANRADNLRAQTACLEARGYSVR